MKRLIVTADDFGIAKSVNKGIAMGIAEGVVTSVALMPGGEAFEDAVSTAKSLKLDEVGAHLSLTGSAACSDPSDVPSLIAGDGMLYPDRHRFFKRFFLRKIDPSHIYTELRRQLKRLEASGLKAVYLTSHEHVHMMPGILEIFLTLAGEYGIPAIRATHRDRLMMPIYPKKVCKKIALACLYNFIEKALRKSGISRTDGFFGFLDSGDFDENVLMRMLESLPDGTTEIVCHPGFIGPEVLDRYRFHINCERELFAVTSPRIRKFIGDNGIKLAAYGGFLREKSHTL